MKTRRTFPSLIFTRVLLAGFLMIALIALAAQPVQVTAAPSALTLDWYATAGAGSYSTSGNLSLESTVGQSIARMPNPSLCAGFLCGRVDLPQRLFREPAQRFAVSQGHDADVHGVTLWAVSRAVAVSCDYCLSVH